ncbi:sorbose reductase sou1 [Pilatotrama ljubarskyi]|nr:sorbose reductase sou1 [Pilatotrama ljubarskyi]
MAMTAHAMRRALHRCTTHARPAGIHLSKFSTALVAASQHKSAPGGAVPDSDNSLDSDFTPDLLKDRFSLADRVALVTGANSGLGLQSVLALVESGARVVYCLDLAEAPSPRLSKVQEYVSRMQGEHAQAAGSRIEYIRGDVRDQEKMWKVGEMIGDREGRFDVLDVNLKGTLFTAQAAGQQMERFKNGGSIMLIASIAGHVNVRLGTIHYEATKGAVLQMARTMACELAEKGIRVNSISPGFHDTELAAPFKRDAPELMEALANMNPMKRFGQPHELRGVVAWLASDASSFCTGSDIRVDGGYVAW